MDMVTFSLGLIVGMVLVTLVFGVGIYYFVSKDKTELLNKVKRTGTSAMALALLTLMTLALAAGHATAAFAQADTPVPLVIPVNTIFTQTNNWIATFAPIAAIGIGITLALAVLTYLGKMIKSAFV